MPRVLTPLACLLLSGCAAAQMQLPAHLAASATRAEFAGIGGWPKGAFTAGPYRGRFERSLEVHSFSDATVTRAGHSEFTIVGPAIRAPVTGRCSMQENAVDLGLAEVTVRPMAYRCAVPGGYLELQETVGGGSAITRYERHGTIEIDGVHLQIRSVHHIAGTPMPSLTPVGYVFERDGDQVAALELTGHPALISGARLDPATARAVNVAAVALAIFWDPAVHDAEG